MPIRRQIIMKRNSVSPITNWLSVCKNTCANTSWKKGLKVWNQSRTFVNQILLSTLWAGDRDPVNLQETAKLPDKGTAKYV